MASTITIDDEIFEQLKARAARESTSVRRLIEDSLRVAILTPQDQPPAEQPFELVTFGKGGQFTTYDVDRTSALLELDDIATHRN
jgi:hypothetical protein